MKKENLYVEDSFAESRTRKNEDIVTWKIYQRIAGYVINDANDELRHDFYIRKYFIQ